MEEPSQLILTNCSNQLAIRCIYDTQITLEWLRLKEEAQLASLIEGRHGCAHDDVIECSSHAD